MRKLLLILLIAGCQSLSPNQKLVEKAGFIEVEAEDFHDQQKDEVRKWVRFDLKQSPEVLPDHDGMQWCEGKNQWTWASKQRTDANHCGEPYHIFLDVDTKGEHTVQFSMREDGFEFDKFILTTDKDFIPEELKVDTVLL
jgi:hypothetical protein